ncbi:MAG: ribonuclease HII [Nanoarchaeota archaeon]|nr:ribonuclease HII [Nanoarchaeota archaeon]
MSLLGIDDAGRGPLIGPMILAGVLINKEQEKTFKKEQVTDSKLLFHEQRVRLAKTIKENSLSNKIIKVSAEEIDISLKSGTNLNKLEAKKSADIINYLNNTKKRIQVIIDCPSVNTSAWKKTLLNFIKHPANLTIKCEHKADFNYAVVSAASILAKVAREEEVAKIKKQFGNIGSGYPSDPTTKEFLKKHGKALEDSGIFRKTWATWKKAFPDKKQKKLSDF